MKLKWIALPFVLTAALVLGACAEPTVEEPEIVEEPVEGMEETEVIEEPMEETGEEAE